MANRRVLLGGGLLLAAAAGAALLVGIESPALGQAALARLGAATGARITAEEARFSVLRGITLRGVQATSAMAGGQWTLDLDALVLDHRLLPLLSGRVEIDRILLRRPRLRVEQRPAAVAPAAAGAGAGAATLGLALSVRDVQLDDGTVELITPGQPTLTVSGLEVTLRSLGLAADSAATSGLAATGEARAASIRLARTAALDARGRFRLGAGLLSAERLSFRNEHGAFEASLEARLDRLPLTYTLALRGDPLDLNAMAGLKDGSFGPATLELRGQGIGPAAEGLRGEGVLKMQGGRLPSSPLIERLDAALGAGGLAGAAYQPTQAPFRLRDGRAYVDALTIEASPLRMDVRGWMAMAGPLSLSAAVRLPRERVRLPGMASGALDLLTDAEGRVVVPVIITGTQQAPVVRPDVGALTGQARRGVGRALAREAAQELGRLLRR